MKRPGTAQEWVHWLETGAGARWFVRGAVMLAFAVLAAVLAYKQFRGPVSELTLLQAGVGRQLAAGEGFTSPVSFPQTAAYLQAHGIDVAVDAAMPELAQPPLYSLLIAGLLAVLGPGIWAPPVSPAGLGADYALLALNMFLLGLAAFQTWRLGARLFDERTGALAGAALLVSAPIWQQTVAVNGTPLPMVLLLALTQALERGEAAREQGRGDLGWCAAAGLAGAALFLTEYPAGLLVVLSAGHVAWRSRRKAAVLVVLAGFLAATAPWMVRNVILTGSPVGLAWEDVALRYGDSTAEPSTRRASLEARGPEFDLNKFGNKGLTSLQAAVRDHLWGGGAMFLSAFFIAGGLYRFRSDRARHLRIWSTLALGVLVVGQAFLNSGEGERHPLVYGAPLILIFGAAFFGVLVESHPLLAPRALGATLGLLCLQSIPLAQDVLEPRAAPFHYPPYHPTILASLGDEFARRSEGAPVWMADVPAGAAWYSGQRVWAQPATLRDFYTLSLKLPVLALVLTPATLDRPFFSDLAATSPDAPRFGDWDRIYLGLLLQRFPAEFPLGQTQKLADNFYVLVDPSRPPQPGK